MYDMDNVRCGVFY